MKYIYCLILIISPIISNGQTHSIDKYHMQMSGVTIDNDVSINTFYNSYDTCNISWLVIKDSMPPEWAFSFCFPNCYAQGVISNQNQFYPGENHYLNCHVYPNGKMGEGIIQMEITTNNIYKDTVTWRATINSISSMSQIDMLCDMELNNIYDLSGRKVNAIKINGIYIVKSNDGVYRKIQRIN